jgi:hypothetical protein
VTQIEIQRWLGVARRRATVAGGMRRAITAPGSQKSDDSLGARTLNLIQIKIPFHPTE